jgi:Ca2+-dependent lipid-binding protein
MGPQKFTTHTIDNSLNPKWNTSMQFQIYDLNKDQLTFTISDQKIYSPNVLLGKARVNVSTIYQEQVKENNPIIKVYRLSDGTSGKVMIKMNISIYQ